MPDVRFLNESVHDSQRATSRWAFIWHGTSLSPLSSRGPWGTKNALSRPSPFQDRRCVCFSAGEPRLAQNAAAPRQGEAAPCQGASAPCCLGRPEHAGRRGCARAWARRARTLELSSPHPAQESVLPVRDLSPLNIPVPTRPLSTP